MLMSVKCSECSEDTDYTLIEWMWAYDWYLATECNKCKTLTHRNWLRVIACDQSPKYWPVYFILENPEDKKRLRYVNQYPYDRKTDEKDKIFDELENSIIS